MGNLTSRRIVSATIFVDHFSEYTYPHLMEDPTLNETLVAKEAYEMLAAMYHSDNGRYADAGWQEACISMQQSFSYCGVGQHNQNRIAENRIRDLSDAVRACFLHAKHRWPEGVCTYLWPFALKYICDTRSKVRIRENGKTAEENFAQSDGLTGARLEHFHPFGCPAYVLDARLQGGVTKIPRWDPRSRIGLSLGHSPYQAIISKQNLLRTMSFASLLKTMSFASLQLRTYSNRRRLEDGTHTEQHAMAFAAHVVDTEAFHYGDAMKQPDKVIYS